MLRRFELALLREIGYGLRLDAVGLDGSPVQKDLIYVFDPQQGPRVADRRTNAVQFSGSALLAIAADDWSEPSTSAQAKILMRQVLAFHLGNQDLNTRALFKEISLP